MLGQPDEAAKVAKLASHLGVIDSLIIHNPVIDAAPFYSALDGFLMPSLYEGLGFAQIEAQCASLPILCSDILSEEADITELIKKCALNDTPSEWAKKLYELVNAYDGRRKKAFADQVAEAGFSIDSCVDQVLCLLRGEHV